MKVALTGDGADETFLGYNRYVKEKIRIYIRSRHLRQLSNAIPRKFMSPKIQSGIELSVYRIQVNFITLICKALSNVILAEI